MGFLDDVVIDGAKLDADISGRIRSARSIRTMDGASTIELEVIDHDHRIRETGILTRRGKPPKDTDLQQSAWGRFGQVRLTIAGRFYRLAGYAKQPGSDMLLLTWEDEIATLMRGKLGPRKASRGDISRVDFIRQGARRVRAYRIAVKAPEADEKQPIRGDTPRQRAKDRERGFSKGSDITVKGAKADREQRRNLEDVLAVADEEKAGERATLALLVAVIQESLARNLTGGHSSSVGILQLLNIHLGGSTSTSGGRRDIELVTRMFLKDGFTGNGGAKKIAQENPSYTPADIAAAVQGNANGASDYAPWEDEAATILDAYGGVGRLVVDRKRYEFEVAGPDRATREPAENEWDASGRLVEEVRFRRFATDNVLWVVSDEWLFQREPMFYLRDESHTRLGVQAHIGMPIAEVEVEARKPAWTGRPGAVAEIDKREGEIAGRWLVAQIIEDLLGVEDAQLLLRRPAPKLKEPSADKSTRLLTESTPEAGSVRSALVDMALKALERKSDYQYAMVRPYPRSLFAGTRGRGPTGVLGGALQIDCSSFVTLVYKAAGAPDPNNLGYNGAGNTVTLWANGRKTNDPQPGDLAFYGSTSQGGAAGHVNIYIGNGESVNMGPSAGVSRGRTRSDFRPDFIGYRTYELGG